MSSYRSNYGQWKAGSSSSSGTAGSSYISPTSTGIGSLSSKFGGTSSSSSGYKPSTSSSVGTESSSKREPSFVGASSSSVIASKFGSRYGGTSTTPTSSSSVGSKKLETSGSENASNLLKAGGKTSVLNSSSYGLNKSSAVAALSSKFASSSSSSGNDATPSSTTRPSSSSAYNTYLRNKGAAPLEVGVKDSPSMIDSPKSPISKPSPKQDHISDHQDTKRTSLYRPSTGSSTPGSSSSTTDHHLVSPSPSTLSTSLRTSMRFGLRNYNSLNLLSSPSNSTSSTTVSINNALKALNKDNKSSTEKRSNRTPIPPLSETPEGLVTSWMSRGIQTEEKTNSSTSASSSTLTSCEISSEEIPSFEPRIFSPWYDGVLKQKGVQTEPEEVWEKEQEKERMMKVLSSIPRPSSLNYYANKFNSTTTPPGPTMKNAKKECSSSVVEEDNKSRVIRSVTSGDQSSSSSSRIQTGDELQTKNNKGIVERNKCKNDEEIEIESNNGSNLKKNIKKEGELSLFRKSSLKEKQNPSWVDNKTSGNDNSSTINKGKKESSPSLLMKSKSMKRISPSSSSASTEKRKSSTPSLSESSSGVTGSSPPSSSVPFGKNNKLFNKSSKSLAGGINNLENKDTTSGSRRGSLTSSSQSSSTVSSRSNSVERNKLNNSNAITIKSNATSTSTSNKPPKSQSRPSSGLIPAPSSSRITANAKDSSSGGGESNASNKKVTNKSPPGGEPPQQSSFMDRVLGTGGNSSPFVRKCQSGELPWWLRSNPDPNEVPASVVIENETKKEEEDKNEEEEVSEYEYEEEEEEETNNDSMKSLGERTAPDGTEATSMEPCIIKRAGESRRNSFFIGDVANIDEILGRGYPPPLSPIPPGLNGPSSSGPQNTTTSKEEDEEEECSEEEEEESEYEDEEEDEDDKASKGFEQALKEFSKFAGNNDGTNMGESKTAGQRRRSSASSLITGMGQELKNLAAAQKKLDDSTLQVYKDGEFGPYLDLDLSLGEQLEDELEGFLDNRKNSIVLRAQLPVRVHAIIEKLLKSDGRELRRALFSLKQIFQEDKDLVHEFVGNGGLSCLIKVGSDAVDQNYQNYILRAIGQVMLYVDGMYGVMRHNETVQWLYTLVSSKHRLVQKTALKLLLVFVDYVETNCLLLVQAVGAVDNGKGLDPWSNIMNLLKDSSGDTELLVYAMTLVNKVLNAIPDIDMYYDQVDVLERQGMAGIIQSYMGNKQCADLDLLKQFQVYELVLKHEDGKDGNNIMMELGEDMRNKLMNRANNNNNNQQGYTERRSPRRYSSSKTAPLPPTPPSPNGPISLIPSPAGNTNNNKELTPGLRRRREAAAASEHQPKNLEGLVCTNNNFNASMDSPTSPEVINASLRRSSSRNSSLELQNNLKNNNETNSNSNSSRPWMLPIYTNNSNGGQQQSQVGDEESEEKFTTVKDITQKLANQNLLNSPSSAEEGGNKTMMMTVMNGMEGLVSKAKEGLAKSTSKVDIQKPTDKGSPPLVEVKKSDNELHWDFLVSNLQRPLEICDLDFTDLNEGDEDTGQTVVSNGNPSLPPPVPLGLLSPPPPPPGNTGGIRFNVPPPPMNMNMNGISQLGGKPFSNNNNSQSDANKKMKKTKKTVKLFWKEVRDNENNGIIMNSTTTSSSSSGGSKVVDSLWNEIQPAPIDTVKLENLFESRANKDFLMMPDSSSANSKSKEILVLDPKRSNAINIAMTKLPPPRTIKTAIMKMDSTIINREGIEKLLAMLPTPEERSKITEAQFSNPEIPLGSAEQFLLTLSSISELTARLKLWAFKMDYENLEREVAEPLMDLKTGIDILKKNKTFRHILATLLSIGNFLNGADAKGFQIDYLAKVPEVKDTVQKHSLLHHLCQSVTENYPDSSDLYSEIGPVTRASRVDFDEICSNLAKMENDCKASWDHLKVIAKHDGPTNLKLKLSEFLADSAERIIVLGIIHRRVMNRFQKFLIWLGISPHTPTKPHSLFKIISEFALEYRTTRERVIQQMEKKANHRERNKTRGKMIINNANTNNANHHSPTSNNEHDELEDVLNNKEDHEPLLQLQRGSTRKPPVYGSSKHRTSPALITNAADDDLEILESLVKTATRKTGEAGGGGLTRKRNSASVRTTTKSHSVRRTLRHGLTEEERKMLAAFMASGHSFCS